MKCSMSEALSVMPVLRHWVRTVAMRTVAATDAVLHACQAFIMLVTLVDMLVDAQRGRCSAIEIATATQAFLEMFAQAFGVDEMFLKFHLILHHALTVARYGWSPNTMALERKHKSILQYGVLNNNLKNYGGAVLREVLNKSLHTLDTAPWLNMDVGLIEPRLPSKRLAACLTGFFGEGVEHFTAYSVRYNAFSKCSCGDLVAKRASAGGWCVARVLFPACSAGETYVALQPFELQAYSETYSTWREAGMPFLADTDDLLETLIYSVRSGVATVLHPLSLTGA